MPIVSFKDFTPVQYTDGESEMQDRYAFKRKHQPMDEAEDPAPAPVATATAIERIRAKMHERGLRRSGMKRLRPRKNDAGGKRNRASDRAGL